MTEQLYDEKEVLVSEHEGVYTIDIWVTDIRERFIFAIVFMIRRLAKKYHQEYVYKRIVAPIEVRKHTVYMDGKKVKIRYNFEEDGFDLYTGIFKGYAIDGGVTEEFRTFLENKKIPYR